MEADDIFEAPPDIIKDEYAYSFPEAIDTRSISIPNHEDVDIIENLRDRSHSMDVHIEEEKLLDEEELPVVD